MNVRWLKTVTKIVSKSKDTIIKYAPQIMAAAGATCFMAATYCAVKETPQAMEKLEEKKALDPDMSTLQKVAVVAPEYKKTICFTLAGVGFTAGAWKIEAARMAEVLGALSMLQKDNDKLIEAAKEVVGEEKTGEIMAKKEELLADNYQTEDGCSIPSDQIPYLFKFPGGVKFWTTWAKFKAGMEYNRRCLATNKSISKYEVLMELGADENDLTQDMYNEVWDMEDGAEDYLAVDETIDAAYELLDYEATPYDHGRGDNHVSAWEIKWIVNPKHK